MNLLLKPGNWLLAYLFMAILLPGTAAIAQQTERPDVVIADFEGETYGDWKAEGEAFGTRSGERNVTRTNAGQRIQGTGAREQLSQRRPHDWHLDVTTDHDRTELPEFPDRWRWPPGKTCMNLLVDGEIVRTVTGDNTQARRQRGTGFGVLGRHGPGGKNGHDSNRGCGNRGLGAHQCRPHLSRPTRNR